MANGYTVLSFANRVNYVINCRYRVLMFSIVTSITELYIYVGVDVYLYRTYIYG
jgi:hypothetical protein